MLTQLTTFLLVFLHLELSSSQTYYRICFFPNWGQDRGGNETFTVSSVTDPALCTHIMYSFARVVPENNTIGAYRPDDGGPNGGYKNITDLKRLYPGLKIILDVGGWNHASAGFVDIISSYSRILAFSSNVCQFLTSWNFDGLDLDWEYPAHRGGKPSDRRGYTILVKTLRRAFEDESKRTGNARLLLSASVASSKKVIDKAYEIDKISRYLDFLGVMPFDFFGDRYYHILHHSALYGRSGEDSPYSESNMHYAIQYYISKGTPRNKIVFGVPFYSRPLKLLNSSLTTLGAPHNGTDEIIPYHKICQFESRGWRKAWHREHKVPYVYGDNLWIAYDDKRSLQIKVDYIRDNGLLGYMAWEMSYDDFSGEFCGQGRYPLLNSLKTFIEAPREKLKPENSIDSVPKFDKDGEDCKNCSSNPAKPPTPTEPCATCSVDDDVFARIPVPRRDDVTTTRRPPATTAVDTTAGSREDEEKEEEYDEDDYDDDNYDDYDDDDDDYDDNYDYGDNRNTVLNSRTVYDSSSTQIKQYDFSYQDVVIGGVVGGFIILLVIIGIVVTGVKSANTCTTGLGKRAMYVNTAVPDPLDVNVPDVVTPLPRDARTDQTTYM